MQFKIVSHHMVDGTVYCVYIMILNKHNKKNLCYFHKKPLKTIFSEMVTYYDNKNVTEVMDMRTSLNSIWRN